MKIRCDICLHSWEKEGVPVVHFKNGGGRHMFCPFCLTDQYLVEEKPNLSMEDVYAAHIPGFYKDECGAYCMMIGKYLISCNINEDTGEYDVCIDVPGFDGLDNIDWVSYTNAEEAIERLKLNIDTVLCDLMK